MPYRHSVSRGSKVSQAVAFVTLLSLTGSFGYAADETTPPADASGATGCTGDLAAFAARPTPHLDKVSRDLTDMGRKGKLDPVIGREKEVTRMVQILMRRSKNNPVVIGEAGVGKTALVEGLAQLIADGKAPRALKRARIVSLNLGSLIAGTKFRGEFENRLKTILEELEGSPHTILFIDEIHTLVGAGGADGGMDAANLLKPAMSRGLIKVIGATTLDEYRKHIEKDPALERRFQPVVVDPPSKPEAVEILRGLRSKFEKHHEIEITDEALKLAVELSDRYINNGRHLPDKAIDLIDEAGSHARLKAESALAGDKKPVLDAEAVREVISTMTGIDLRTLDGDDTRKLLNIEADLNSEVIGQEEAVGRIARVVRKAKADLKDPKRPIASFLFAGPTGTGKTLLAKKLAKLLFGSEEALMEFDMSEYQEKHTASRLVGAPPGYVGYEEGGQLTEKVRRRPYSIVLLDEIEKAHPDVYNLFLQVMEEGRLTDGQGRVVDFRNCIIIYTTNQGAAAIQGGQTFRLGEAPKEAGRGEYEAAKERLKAELDKAFKPEFLNRLDDTIVFRGLSHEQLLKIVDIEMGKVSKRLAPRNLGLDVSEEAKSFLLDKANTAEYGGRALRRSVEIWMEEPIADEILRGKFDGYTKIRVGVGSDGGEPALTFEPGN